MALSVLSLAVWHPMLETVHLKCQLENTHTHTHTHTHTNLLILFRMAIYRIINLNTVFPKHFLINFKNQHTIFEHILANK